MNQTLKNGIRAHLAEGFQFSAALLRTLLHYRAAKHTTTDSSPALLMLGRELSLPLDRLRVPAHLTSHGAQRETTDQLRDRVSARQQATKQRFDRSHRAKHPAFTILDWVRVRRPTRGHKLLSFWSAPFQVTEQLGPATFRLLDGTRWHASAKWPHLPRQTWRPAEILIRTLEAQSILQHDQSVPVPNRATSGITMFECFNLIKTVRVTLVWCSKALYLLNSLVIIEGFHRRHVLGSNPDARPCWRHSM